VLANHHEITPTHLRNISGRLGKSYAGNMVKKCIFEATLRLFRGTLPDFLDETASGEL
jgi:hypothetical protein